AGADGAGAALAEAGADGAGAAELSGETVSASTVFAGSAAAGDDVASSAFRAASSLSTWEVDCTLSSWA
ncbi:MAG TPA: hypothetical protein VGG23_00870, partial [Acidimicrobiales bacterium]